MVQEFTLLFDLGLVLVAGTVFGFIARELKQPLLVGYILAGLVIGPLGLHLIGDYAVISVLSELGVAFLLFAVGMEIDFSKLSRFKSVILVGGIAQVVLTTLIAALAVFAVGFAWLESVYLGLIVAFSSSVIAVKILTDSKQLNSLEGKLIIGYALVQDLLAVILLPLLQNPATLFSVQTFAPLIAGFAVLIVTGFVLSKWVFPRVTTEAAKNQEVFFLTTVSSCFVFVFLSNWMGFPLAVGAFIGGLALGRIPFNLEAQNSVHYIRDLFGTVFFVSLGLQLKVLALSPLFWILLGIVFVLNPLIFTVLNLLLGFGLQTSLTVGLALFQASEFSFILGRQGLELGQLSQSAFDTSVWVILLSMILTPYMVRFNRPLYRLFSKIISRFRGYLFFFERRVSGLQNLPPQDQLSDHIVIAGAGVFGRQLVDSLRSTERVLVLEQDPDIVSRLQAEKVPAIYSSRSNLAVLEKIGLEKAKLLVVTIPDPVAALSLVRLAREKNPSLAIFGRCHRLSEAQELYAAGADMVILPQVMASNYCLQEIQKSLASGKRPNYALQERFLGYLAEEQKPPGFQKPVA